MFNLTLRDHIQLTFTEIIKRHNAHAAKAQSRARWSRRLRGSEALLVGGAAIAAAGAAFGHGQMLAIAAASMGGSLSSFCSSISVSISTHPRDACRQRRPALGVARTISSLLSDLHDGALSLAEARLRRDRLIDELRAVYDVASVIELVDDPAPPAPPADKEVAPPPPAYRSA